VGPDLQKVASGREKSWILKSITTPEQRIAQNDPIAKQLVQEYGMAMPNLGISENEAEALFAYLQASSGQEKVTTPSAANETAPAPVTVQGDATAGRALFIGETSFAKGGVACVSCHTVSSYGGLGGGTLAKDLTGSYAALGQDGLKSILTSNPFPLMKATSGNNPLTENEVANLVTFLQQESGEQDVTQVANPYTFPIVGLVVFIVLAGLIQAMWMRRLRGVRQTLLKGGSK
jgi:mono/diheme cytochrome c family protein